MLAVSGVSHNNEMALLMTSPQEQNLITSNDSSTTHSQLMSPKMNLFDFENFPLEMVESRLNYQGNYQNYVYNAMKSMLPLKNLNFSEHVELRHLYLPECFEKIDNMDRKTLILDLDETLIHADFEGVYLNHDMIVNFNFGQEEVSVPIFVRPGLFDFLQNISQEFEIIIFTASIKEYADAVLNRLDPENKFFKFRFYRSECISVNSKIFIKDLRIFKNRNLQNIILVDNSMYSFANQISNGVLINSFYHDKDDRELFNLYAYLKNYLLKASDVRHVNNQFFNFETIEKELTLGLCTID
jgi:Dullard-like phosphatase family protein